MNHLRNIRTAKGWTQTELAKRAGFKPGAIGHWETGRRDPSWANAMRLADTLGVSLDGLAGRECKEDVDAKWRQKLTALLET